MDEYEYREYPEINGIKRYLFLATASLEDVITFYNSTLPYCYAVTSGSCYDSSSGQVIP